MAASLRTASHAPFRIVCEEAIGAAPQRQPHHHGVIVSGAKQAPFTCACACLLSRIFEFQPSGPIYSRIEILMNSENGLIGLAWASLREAWYGEYASRLNAGIA
jgi:hypothetical protein